MKNNHTGALLAAGRALLLMVALGVGGGGLRAQDFNPENPGNPGEPTITTYYTLTTSVSPATAGSSSPTSKSLAEGGTTTVYATANSNYTFVKWTSADTVVSTSRSFTYTMPAEDVELTAVFTFDPSAPDNPDEPTITTYYTLTTSVSPATAGSSSPTSKSLAEGGTTTVYATANSNYTFVKWTSADTVVSTSRSFTYTMPAEDVELTAVFTFDPSAPDNPGANYYDSGTGEVIVDDFEAGSLASAIDEVIGGSSYRSTVTQVTVSGEMASGDFSFVDNLTNCTYADLSRAYGFTAIPNRAFDGTNLSSIVLPSVVESIGNYAFRDCEQLTSVSLYAVTPPTLGTDVFDGIPDGLVVYVPAVAVSIYADDEDWGVYTILPLEDDVYELTVNLPDDASDGRYKDMTLELINTASGQRYKYVITDRTVYTFNSLMSGTTYNVYVKNASSSVLGTLTDVAIGEADVEVSFESLLQPHDVSLTLLTPDGSDVTDQATIAWYDASGNYLKQASSLTGQIEESTLSYTVSLPQALALVYATPESGAHTVASSGNSLTLTLEAFTETTLTGYVADSSTGNAISGATVTVSQLLNNKYTKTFTTTTDSKGAFTLTPLALTSTLTVSATDYVAQTIDSLALDTLTDAGTIALSSITGARITTNYTYTESVAEGSEATTQDWYTDYANVAYSLYNVSTQQDITQFSVQYPQVVLLEDVAEGDVLRLTASSRKGAFEDVAVECTISNNAATVTIPIVQLGQISATFTSTDNAAVVGILYNAAGQYQKCYTYTNAQLSITDLADGNYTLVSMGSSSLFNSIMLLSQYAEAGLTDGTHYVQSPVSVQSGVISEVTISEVPLLDESTFTFTGDGTYFTVNKTSITSGNYLTLKGRIDFLDEYADAVEDVSLVVDLPDECSFVENSVMVGTSLTGYTVDGSRITIPISNLSDYARFCIIPTLGGDYAPSAYAAFTLGGTEVLQPIGNAAFSVNDLSITVPSVVAKTSVAISGTATGNSAVTIYDGDAIIGSTTALANGSWNATCELNNPYNLSTHDICAKVITTQGLELQSETEQVQYDANAVMVSKVSMYHDNPETKTTYEIVYDFINPSSSSQYYIYYIYNKVFTFTIEFTNNSPDVVDDVVLYVKTGTGNQVALEAAYDSIQDLWVTSGEFGNGYDGDIPVNVSVSMTTYTEAYIDAEEYNTAINLYNDEQETLQQEQAELNALLTAYEDIIESDEIDYEAEETLIEELFATLGIERTAATEADTTEVTYEAMIAATDSLLSDSLSGFGIDLLQQSLAEVVDMMEGISIDDCNDLTAEDLLSAGYEAFTQTDGNCLYILATSSTYELVDLANNLRYVLDLENASLAKLLRANSATTFSSEINSYIEKCSSVCDNLRTSLSALAEAIENVESILTKRSEELAKRISTLEGAIKALEANGPSRSLSTRRIRLAALLKEQAGANWGLSLLNKKWIQQLKVGSRIGGVFAAFDVYMLFSQMSEDLNAVLSAYNKIPEDCPDDQDRANSLRSSIRAMGIGAGVYYLASLTSDLAQIYSAVTGVAAAVPTGGTSLSMVVVSVGLTAANVAAGVVYSANFSKNLNKLLNQVKELACVDDDDDDDDDDGGDYDSGNPDTSYGLDPSGYVYEGVSSNRLEGVTATCYYKETLEDMYGDVYEVVDIWDAAAYAQENPLFTDENGMYRWDVPEGLWQVKFEKDGYVTAYSEWLPVPPPQLDVNIAMTQNLQPDVLSATAYEEGIEIVFDKYMTPETMTTEYIYAVVNEEGVEGSVVLLDEEASYEGSSDTYVSRVRFVPTEAFTAGSEVTLVVSRKVSSYAGLSMQSDFTQVFDVEQEVTSIEVDSVLNVSYGGTKTFIVQALPASAAAGRCLVVGVSSSKIATASVDSIVLDEYGQALITLSGVLPGITAATFSIVGSSVVGSATVQVESASNFTAEPVASRASGTAVYYGATVALTCDTENAVIYYTTDGTCPCDASGSRQVYSEPIVITEALTIRAMAVAEGMYESDVVAFSYTVIEPSDVEVTIYNPGYATLYYGDRALQVPEGLDAYTVTAADSLSATLTPIADGIIPAKTGVVLKTAADAYEGSTNPEDYLMYTLTLVDDAESVEAVSGNLLVGTDEAVAITLSSEFCYYTLSLSDPEDVTTIGFHALADTLLTFTNPAHEAFLPLANNLGAVLSLVIDDGNDTGDGGDEQDDPTTDLSRISADDESHCIYTITGIRLTESINALPPGLYIVDGRRVYITNKHIH